MNITGPGDRQQHGCGGHAQTEDDEVPDCRVQLSHPEQQTDDDESDLGAGDRGQAGEDEELVGRAEWPGFTVRR